MRFNQLGEVVDVQPWEEDEHYSAVELRKPIKVPTRSGFIDAKAGDWVLLTYDNTFMVLTADEFPRQYFVVEETEAPTTFKDFTSDLQEKMINNGDAKSYYGIQAETYQDYLNGQG